MDTERPQITETITFLGIPIHKSKRYVSKQEAEERIRKGKFRKVI